MKVTIGIADDQQLFLRSLASLINTFDGFTVVVDANNGADMLGKLAAMEALPDILLLDVSMPVMDGVKTAEQVSKKFPSIKMVALTSKEDDYTILNMIRANCCSYLLKEINPEELEKALIEVSENGFYNADEYNKNHRRLKQAALQANQKITDRERDFLKYACTDLTYKVIAAKMHLAERTIDGYREALFEKLNVQSRVGMALEAIRRNLVEL